MKYGLFLLLFWGLLPLLPAQQAALVPVEQRTVSSAQWEKASGDLDYSRDVPKPPKPPKERPNQQPRDSFFSFLNSPFWGLLLQVVAILLAVAAIGYGIYRMLQEPRNKRIARDGVEITEDNLDAYLHETELDRFLREALARRDYTQAIRIYFLCVIKELSSTGAIHWAPDKTNRDYLREMQRHPKADAFRQLTRTYERIWFGNAPLTPEGFARLEPGFKAMIGKDGG